MPEAHAKRSPSHSATWLTCTKSPELEALMPEEEFSAFANEGTAAHDCAEEYLRKRLVAGSLVGKTYRDVVITEEMDGYIQVYIDYVRQVAENGILMIEQQVTIPFIDDCWGTADAIVLSKDVLHVIDLKFGKGVKVDAVGNTQLLLYASGAYYELGFMGDYEFVEVHIVQPRLDWIDSWKVPVREVS